MEAMHMDIVRALRGARRPLSAGEVANAVGTRVNVALDALGYLVRHGGAKRHHCADAVMRYGPAGTPRAARKPKALDPEAAPRAALALRAIDAGYTCGRDIAKAINVTQSYTSVILHRLQAQGLVRNLGQRRGTRWERVRDDNALPPSLADAQRQPIDAGDDDELPPCLGERMRDTFNDMFRAAADAALDAEDHTP